MDPDYPHLNKKKIVIVLAVALIILLLLALLLLGFPAPTANAYPVGHA